MIRFLFTLCIVLLSASLSWAQIKDEIQAQGQRHFPSEPVNFDVDGSGLDAPMRTAVDLKAVQAAFNQSDPRENVKNFQYDTKMTYKIRLREYMGCSVILPRGEKIKGYALFDSVNFTFTPASKDTPGMDNYFEIFGKHHGADTNLIVYGDSGNVYSFYIRNDSINSPHVPDFVVYVDDKSLSSIFPPVVKPASFNPIAEVEENSCQECFQKNPPASQKEDNGEYLRSLPLTDPSKINWSYSVTKGNRALAPKRIFDDGYWTYFQFGDGNLDKVRRLPTIYRVVGKYDNIVNTRAVGGTLIVETISERWTLRNGDDYLCVWNYKD